MEQADFPNASILGDWVSAQTKQNTKQMRADRTPSPGHSTHGRLRAGGCGPSVRGSSTKWETSPKVLLLHLELLQTERSSWHQSGRTAAGGGRLPHHTGRGKFSLQRLVRRQWQQQGKVPLGAWVGDSQEGVHPARAEERRKGRQYPGGVGGFFLITG